MATRRRKPDVVQLTPLILAEIRDSVREMAANLDARLAVVDSRLANVETEIRHVRSEMTGLAIATERGFNELRADFRRGDIKLSAADDAVARRVSVLEEQMAVVQEKLRNES